ncbi:MAG TPA: hypothetical protein VHE35_29100 [Kofleriaceae bacterium]|nr:hypothetical protein [Kofleriaceae bacterium]
MTPEATATPEPPIACLPDLDGVLTATEVPVLLDTPLDYYVGADVTVDVKGEGSGDTLHWDWSEERRDDTIEATTAGALGTRWYAGMFPGGQFVSPAAGGLDGIYAKDDEGVYLLGLASPTDAAPTKTLLRYAAPVAILRFPLAVGATWTETGTITGGTLNGLPYNGTDRYDLAADARGELHLPYVRFVDALRVRIRVTSTPAIGGGMTVQRQVGFWAECFGEIGRATSRPNEPNDDFTTAEAQRRLAI